MCDSVSLGGPSSADSIPSPKRLNTKTDWLLDGDFVVPGGETRPGTTPLSELPTFLPQNGIPVKGTVVMINGIMTDAAMQTADLQAMANKGYRVIGIHNATKGMLKDVAQVLGDKLSLTDRSNKAIPTAAALIEDFAERGETLHLVGHSQGASILSRAVDVARERLMARGQTRELAEQKLSGLTVSTMGGSASTYPDGPRYVHYHNRFDPLSSLAGRALVAKVFPDDNEEFHAFNEFHAPHDLPAWSDGISNRFARVVDRMVHGAQDVYIPHFLTEA